MTQEEFEKITGKKIENLSDEEYRYLEKQGLFGKVMDTAVVNNEGEVSRLRSTNNSMIPVNNLPQQQKRFNYLFNKKRSDASKAIIELGDFAATMLNPLWGITSGLVHSGILANDIYHNGLNWKNGTGLALGVLPVIGHGAPRLYNFGLELAAKAGNKTAKAKLFAKALDESIHEYYTPSEFNNFIPEQIVLGDITKIINKNGKKRLLLPSHTKSNPREFVLEPHGNNKFYVHMRTWDGDHIPANLSNAEKLSLFEALYRELPEGSEILFPKSGPGYYATRGTVAGLQRLARDSRFTPGSQKGVLLYIDKDGKTIKLFEGTSFVKTSSKANETLPEPNSWLINNSRYTGNPVFILEKQLETMFDDVKKEVMLYVRSNEFKTRVMNTKLFSNQDYKDLLKEIEDVVNRTIFKGFKVNASGAAEVGGRNRMHNVMLSVRNGVSKWSDPGWNEVTLHPNHSIIQHRANIWHEIWHSIGGQHSHYEKHPQIAKLQKFNESINPLKLSNSMERALDRNKIILEAPHWPQIDRTREYNLSQWAKDNIIGVENAVEVRSRMLAILDRFRQLGYNTEELIKNPDKFKIWIEKERSKGTLFSWDARHLLLTYDIDDLAKYASKMLSGTGALYLGEKLKDKNEKFKYYKSDVK